LHEMLPIPAPFVFGGSFSDYQKQGSKFSRFETLRSFTRTSPNLEDTDEQSERLEDVNSLYAQAREQGIGTFDHIEMPEGSVNIVNLADIARFIEKSWGLSSGDAVDDDVDEEEWPELEELEEPDIPRPVVYSGTFADYKKEGQKFTRFQTLTRFNSAVSVETPHAQKDVCSASFKLLSTIVPDILADITSQLETCREPHVIIEASSSQVYVPCQFLALCTPPDTKDGCVLTTLSDAIVEKMLRSTMAGAKRSVREIAATGSTPSADVAASESFESPTIDLKDVFIPTKSEWSKFSFGQAGAAQAQKDDGSNWAVDSSPMKGPIAFVGSRRRSLSQRSSGSSWGAGGSFLEPICSGKASLGQAFKVTVPQLPSMRG